MLIGISGAARAGKDTVARIITKHYPRFTRYGLADPIKKHMNELLGWDDRHSDGELKEVVDSQWGISPRHAYQTFGTQFGRDMINQNIWVMLAAREYAKRGNMIISDIRFPNEYTDLIEPNKPESMLIYVDRPQQSKIASTHASESYCEWLKGWADHVIVNDGDIGDLERKIITILDTPLTS